MSQDNKVVNYRKSPQFNIGIVIFAFVLVYFLIYLISYITDKHISVYEVQRGQIVRNQYYTGLVLRSEDVTYSDSTGSINYYMKEGDKAGYDDLICSIDKNGDISDEITQAGLNGTTLSADDLSTVHSLITDYAGTQSNTQFYDIYSFKNTINENVQENLYLNALEQLSDKTSSAVKSHTFSFVKAEQAGVLAFYIDGYEDITPDNFSPSDYDPTDYVKSNLKSQSSVSSGDPLYKSVLDENWYIMIPLTTSETTYYKNLQGNDSSFVIKVEFRKDETSTYAYASVANYDTKNFLKLSFNSSMVRFLSDRYVEIELGSNNTTGLKIPNTAITQKEFIKVPKTYVTQQTNPNDEDDIQTGVYKVTGGKEGAWETTFVETELYYELGTYYYIDEDELAVGDVIQKPEDSQTYTLDNTAVLDGVYNLNKGYAVFRQIDVLTSNEEYSILATGTEYGLALYDRIALDGSSVADGEIVN